MPCACLVWCCFVFCFLFVIAVCALLSRHGVVEAVCACTVTWLALLFVLVLLSCCLCLFCSFAGGCLQTFRGQEKSDGLLHGHSYTAHPIGCSVAIAALDAYKNPEFNPNLGLFCPPPTIQNSHARRIDKDAGQRCRTKMQDKDAGQRCRTKMQDKDAG